MRSFPSRCFRCLFFLNLLVYWQLRCVLLLLCFQLHACFWLIGSAVCVCVYERERQCYAFNWAAARCTCEAQVSLVALVRGWTLWKSLRSPRKGTGVQRDRKEDEEDSEWGKEDYTLEISGLLAAQPPPTFLVIYLVQEPLLSSDLLDYLCFSSYLSHNTCLALSTWVVNLSIELPGDMLTCCFVKYDARTEVPITLAGGICDEIGG